MDHAMLRLLATPKTTATRPSRENDIASPEGQDVASNVRTKKGFVASSVSTKAFQDTSGAEEYASSGTSPDRPRCLGRARVGGRRACFRSDEINPSLRREFRGKLWKTEQPVRRWSDIEQLDIRDCQNQQLLTARERRENRGARRENGLLPLSPYG